MALYAAEVVGLALVAGLVAGAVLTVLCGGRE
jgi:hypothetical protein